MKMVCKKLLSLVLVALMLVTALPFQASAADDQIHYVVQHNGTQVRDGYFSPSNGTDSLVSDIIRVHVKPTAEETSLTRIYVSKVGDVDQNYRVAAGGTIYFEYTVAEKEPETPVEPTKPADINWVVKHNGEVKDGGSFTPDAETSLVSNILKHKVPSNLQVGELTKIWSKGVGNTVTTDSYVAAGDTVTFSYTTKTAEPTVKPIHVVVKVNNSDYVVAEYDVDPKNGEYATVENLLSYKWNADWNNVYTYHHAWSHEQGKNLAKDGKVYVGDTLYIALERKSTSGGSSSGSGSNGGSSKFPYSVYLHIYEAGNVKTPLKTVTLDTWSCVKDGVISMEEVKDVVKTYYTAKTSDGIEYDGFYYSTSTTKNDYINDKKVPGPINNLDELRKEGYVHLNIWIDNAKAKTDSSSTSSNPKTGDTIYMAVTVMGLSAASLAAVYYISKKRAVR